MMDANPNSMWDKFRSYRADKKFLDCELKCENESIFCHKLILFCFSPRFRHLLPTLDHLGDEVLTFLLPEVSLKDLRAFLDELYDNLGSPNVDHEYGLDPQLAKMFGLFDYDLMDPTINIQSYLHFEIKPEGDIDEDGDELFNEDPGEIFDEDTFQTLSDLEAEMDEPINRKRRKTQPANYHLSAEEYPEENRNFEDFQVKSEDERTSNRLRRRSLKMSKKFIPKEHKTEAKVDKMTKKPQLERIIHLKQCKHCKTFFRGSRKYHSHFDQVHKPEKSITVGCRYCHREMSLYAFRLHYNRFHASIVCDVCGKTLANGQRLLVHRKNSHTLFKCEVCNKDFKGFTALDSHQAEEHFQGSHSCEVCGKTFGSYKRLVLHKQKSHRREDSMNFKCDYCEKKFATFTKKLNHTHSVHLKDYPFYCRHNCGAKYNDLNNLVRHEKQKHGKPYPTYYKFEHLKPDLKKK